MRVLLNKPPSTNKLFSTRADGGRMKSRSYRAWIEAMKPTLMAQRLRPLPGPIQVSSLIVSPTIKADLDNLLKATLDLLVRFELIEDDSYKILKRISRVEFGPVPDLLGVKMGAVIEIETYDGAGAATTTRQPGNASGRLEDHQAPARAP